MKHELSNSSWNINEGCGVQRQFESKWENIATILSCSDRKKEKKKLYRIVSIN